MPVSLDLSFRKFVNEYYTPLPKTGDHMVRLYRGDSDYVPQFDPNKFELKSMYGPGQYLTDNRHVAFTYTTKGDKGKVIHSYTSSDDDAIKKKYAVLNFICCYLMFKVAGQPAPNADYDFRNPDHEYDYDIDNYFEYKKHLFFYKWARYGEDDPDQKQYANYYAERRAQDEAYDAKYEVMFQKALAHYKKTKHLYKFVLVSGGKERHWEVIDATRKQGHISEFDVPQEVIAHCYDAEAPLDKPILDVLNKCWMMHNRIHKKTMPAYSYPPGTMKERMKHYWDSVKNLTDFVCHNGVMRDWSKPVWDTFIQLMQAQGYTGIRYLGGRITDNPAKHNAYVLWDHSKLVRLK